MTPASGCRALQSWTRSDRSRDNLRKRSADLRRLPDILFDGRIQCITGCSAVPPDRVQRRLGLVLHGSRKDPGEVRSVLRKCRGASSVPGSMVVRIALSAPPVASQSPYRATAVLGGSSTAKVRRNSPPRGGSCAADADLLPPIEPTVTDR